MANPDIVNLDLIQNRIGVFRVGQRFRMPEAIIDSVSITTDGGCVVEFEPYPLVSVVLAPEEDRGTIWGEVFYVRIEGNADVYLFGTPLPAIRYFQLKPKLFEARLSEKSWDDGVLQLSGGSRIAFCGDSVDVIWLGSIHPAINAIWQTITMAHLTDALRLAASSGDDELNRGRI